MADNISGSPESVALELLEIIVRLEGRDLYKHGNNPPDKKWLLDTYGECIATVKKGWYEPQG